MLFHLTILEAGYMKRILYVCIGTAAGGIERSLINTLDAIDIKENEVDLLLWDAPGPLYPFIRKDINIIEREKIAELDFRSCRKLNVLIRNILFHFFSVVFKKPWLAFPSIKKEYDLAVAYSHNDYSSYYVIDRINAREKEVWFHHGIYDIAGENHKRNKAYYPKFNRIVAVSEPCKAELVRVFPEISERICVRYNLVNENRVLNLANELQDEIVSGSYNIVTVGRIAYDKGTDIAIEAAKKLSNAGILYKWFFVGYGTEFERIKNLICEYGLYDRCILLGAKTNPYPYMKVADLYVQPSRVESFGLTVAEARILGKKIIVPHISAIEEQLENYTNKLFFDGTAKNLCLIIEEEVHRSID